jgi:hypothetical protein
MQQMFLIVCFRHYYARHQELESIKQMADARKLDT